MNEPGHVSLPSRLTALELANLSLSQETQIRIAVAGHPNTAPFILGTLAAEFPAEVLSNPALPLLRLADPLMTHRWPDAALLALLRQPDAPDWIRKQALAHRKTELQVTLASHAHLTADEVSVLAKHPSWLVRARIATRDDLSQTILERLAGDLHYGVRLAVASRVNLPASSFQHLLTDTSRFVRQEARRRTQGAT
ncbi:hypothetical protein D3875_09355 [Deinococcus cavernae]|uniref:Leucine rich repeat variant n=1 Tax=Deinococcus cavernae TaxID=2320857 RepID=A0A418V6M3_9DEIO|nr:hypothetical protein [Deinococcus cavernae]RJF71742.1 hypothetical protein D3875_09355 [Deinococcus cavernae]